jgi:predicted PurR-regulated permease PerM
MPVDIDQKSAAKDPMRTAARDQPSSILIELAIRLGALGLLLYWSFWLVRPFITLVIWSAVLTVALYPIFDWLALRLGGRRRLAAALITIASLLIVIGPVAWLALSLIDGFRILSEKFDLSTLSLPPPQTSIKNWPLIGDQVYEFWDLASTNFRAALAKIIPQLKPLGNSLLSIIANASTGTLTFIASIFVAGFLFSPAPSFVNGFKLLLKKLDANRGEEFLKLAAATIHTVASGIIGISILQSLLAGIGLIFAGIPAAGLLSFGVLIFGIIQIGPSVILIPTIVWSWMTMETSSALMFTAYMLPVNLLDNVLRPILMTRGLRTPMLVTLIGVIGGILAYGITGLFLGPIVLAVLWELLSTWIAESDPA